MTFAWLKSLTPRSLIGRTSLILLVPIVAIQLVVSYVFIQRLYERVTEQMTASVLPSLAFLAERIEEAPDLATALPTLEPAADDLGVGLRLPDGPVPDSRDFWDLSGRVVAATLRSELPGVGPVDLASVDRRVRFELATSHGPVVMEFARNRASASNPHQLLVLMVFVSIIAAAVSFLFLKNQVRPIRRLAEAAEAFGRGRVVPYAPSGATEVRLAGAAFLDMRSRIERHIEQRTLLLSGVSHDLRTPLTRMKLGLSMLEDEPEVDAMRADLDEMEAMLNAFLDFARTEATEEAVPVEVVSLARRTVERARKDGGEVTLVAPEEKGMARLRPMAVERALDNLIGNALRYAGRARVEVTLSERTLRFRVEDDGPGIPPELREEAMKAFARLDAARNQDRGGGVGLGLAIVSDVARQHGGSLRLGTSDRLGGLRADLVLAR